MNAIAHKLILNKVADLFIEQMPFHRLIGLRVRNYSLDGVEVWLPMHNDLVGNPYQGILHGGVTASLLDVAGGLVVAAACIREADSLSPSHLKARLSKLGTIDLRVDYLRPGRGKEFIATARVIRSGSKVAVARMELHNEKGEHIAFGTGTYLVG
ncbi:thioesterase family protein [Zobellella sp. An-6]|uniref:thioesterase family protein n=1 Tax=Zobellella sp. An-6 TaxID=3400218 RepID=UPI004041A3A3